MRWTVVIPVKALPAAKSRLAEWSTDPAAHERLVAALRADTVAAASATPEVARVLLVADAQITASSAVQLLVQSRPGLNEAIAEGAEFAQRTWPDEGVAALLGDLPSLLPDELSAALAAAGEIDNGFVADAAGSGTTLLTARPGVALNPQFGVDSAARHGGFAAPLPAGPGLRQDVDTQDDLRVALELGVGPATVRAAAAASSTISTVHLGGR